MKKIVLIILSIIILNIFVACNNEIPIQNSWEIYLVSDGILPQTEKVDINKLTLEETPVLTLNDIQKYYWDEQVFLTKNDLILEQIKAHNNHVSTGGLPYVVVVNGERIYMGKFWTSLSSVWAYSPSIMVDMTFGIDVKQYNIQPDQQLYKIYWNDEESKTKKAIFDERIYKVLEQNNLLSELTD